MRLIMMKFLSNM